MNAKLNALGLQALRSEVVVKQLLPDDLPLEQLLAVAVLSAANAKMRLERRKQIEEKGREDILPHYFFHFPPDVVAQSVLNLVVCAYQNVGWTHTRIVGTTLVIAREPYAVPVGRGGEVQLDFLSGSPAEAVDDYLVGHHGGGYSAQQSVAAAPGS